MWTAIVIAAAGVLFPASASTVQDTAGRQAETVRTPPDNAGPFLGEWTSIVDGPSGPLTFALALKVREGKIVATVDSDLLGRHEVEEITASDQGIALRYSADLWGYSGRVVVILIRRGEQLAADFSIMNGQFQFSGLLTRQAPRSARLRAGRL